MNLKSVKSVIASASLISLAFLATGCAVVPDRHGGERIVVSPVAAVAALTVGTLAVASQPVYQAPAVVYQKPVQVYQNPPPPVQPLYQMTPVYYPEAQLEALVMAAAVEDIVFANGDTYLWHIDGRGHREAVFFAHGDHRGDLMARHDRRDHRQR